MILRQHFRTAALILTIVITYLFSPNNIMGQEKLTMDESVYALWNTIKSPTISDNGDWISYQIQPGHGDPSIMLHHSRSNYKASFARAENLYFDCNNRYLIYIISAPKDTIKEQKRRGVKKKDLAQDSLIIFDLLTKQKEIYPGVSKYETSEEACGALAFSQKFKPESTKKKSKKSKERLIIKTLETGYQDTVEGFGDFNFADDALVLSYSIKGDTTQQAGVYIYDFESQSHTPVLESDNGEFHQLALDRYGKQIAFIADLDTTDELRRPLSLYYKDLDNTDTKKLLDKESDYLSEGLELSMHKEIRFSKDGSRMFFGTKNKELLQDTSLLEEEIVNVEVWNTKDDYLYTQKEVNVDKLLKESYDNVFYPKTGEMNALNDSEIKNIRYATDMQGQYALATDDRRYRQNISWVGYAANDLYKIDLETGERTAIKEAVEGRASISPNGKFAFWYSLPDSSWLAHNLSGNRTLAVATNSIGKFYDEKHDSPALPRSNGFLGWTTDDENMLIYDRYDIWQISPDGSEAPKRLTNGRENNIRYRYIKVDDDDTSVDPGLPLFLYHFNEIDRTSGYSKYSFQDDKTKALISEDYRYRSRFIKAKNSNDVIFTKESFQQFPDLIQSDLSFKNSVTISNANPQQSKYKWGSNELFSWTAFDGQRLEGLITKPDGFDPAVKYPVIVNFYEKSSDRLHTHSTPSAGRSTINYSFYANRGYVIFRPDIAYKDGYPGESCYNAVMSGIAALIAEGYVDKERIGVQGHSWGGYQIAHLLTKTNAFKCAEAGAPVVNMISAYGGIRWQTGLSRMFQYEKTQSRLGATLWERPELYIENSPIFNIEKVTTPVLIMHNDADGHVPWYQGIEYFVALRRLNKPAWFLNYNGEPHWPLKWQNRVDFNIRLAQFFDYYLMDAPLPEWMDKGVPPHEKGINSGYEYILNKQ